MGMKESNHIEMDPIPDGLEFNESYMESAFALYDAEKRKRKRRLILWWITSALGFSSVLLIGISLFTQHEKSLHSLNSKNKNGKTSVQQGSSNQRELHATPFANEDKQTRDQIDPMKSSQQVTKTYSSNTSGFLKRTEKHAKSTRKSTQNNRPENIGKSKRILDHHISGVLGSTHGKMGEDPTISPTTRDTLKSIRGNQPYSEATHNHPVNEYFSLASRPAIQAFGQDSVQKTLPATFISTAPLAESDEIQKHHVFLNIGVNTLFGMSELKHRATFRESLGLSYSYQFNPKFSISAGLEYHSISRISYKRKIGDTMNWSKTSTTLNKTTLNYISFLPQVHYQIWPKHRISAGLGIEYLLVNPGERYEIDNFTQESSKRTNSKLYYSTFNRYNFSVSFGYSYEFSRFMNVQAVYYYGFTDITINSNFNTTFDRNSRLQLGLKIKLY
jgi:hypothetical protein